MITNKHILLILALFALFKPSAFAESTNNHIDKFKEKQSYPLENPSMQEQEIYQKIGELLWSIMPEEATMVYFTGDIYPEHWSGGANWLLKNGKIETFPFGESPYEIESQIYALMKKLRSLDMFVEKWTNYKITLTEEGKIDFEFAYIPEDDHWPGLFMRGVSELNKDELAEHNIPLEEWEIRIKHREQNKD